MAGDHLFIPKCVRDRVQSQIMYESTCSGCLHKSLKADVEQVLRLPSTWTKDVGGLKTHVEDGLRDLAKPEVIVGDDGKDNGLQCATCNGKQTYSRRMLLRQSPLSVVLVSVNRVKFSGLADASGEADGRPVHAPDIIDFKVFPNAADDNVVERLHLGGAFIHDAFEGVGAGHYMYFDNITGLLYNDSRVTRLPDVEATAVLLRSSILVYVSAPIFAASKIAAAEIPQLVVGPRADQEMGAGGGGGGGSMKDNGGKPTRFLSWCSKCDENKEDSSATGDANSLTPQEKENLYMTCRVWPDKPHTDGDADDHFPGV